MSDDVVQVGATAHFWYPKQGGIEALPRALGERVVGVQLQREVERIDIRDADRRPPGRRAGRLRPHDLHASALPGRLAHRRRPSARVRDACAALRCQGIYCLNIGIDRADVSDKHWVYFYEDEFPFHRLSFPGKLHARERAGGQELDLDGDRLLRCTRALDREGVVERATEALTKAGILRVEDRIELVHTQEILPAYVIYDLEHAANVEVIRSWLAEHGIVPAGRFGEWQYLNMDHAMKSGTEAARAVARRPRHSRRGEPRGRTGVVRGG